MSSKVAIKVERLSKCYQIYKEPRDRLKQFILPRIYKLLGLQPKEYFRKFLALNDVSFEVKKGEMIGIIGRNGSGKSTLLQMICGTLNSSAGDFQANGRIAALLELGSGFNPDFTGRENIYMNGAVLGLTHSEIDSRFESIVAFSEIGSFIDQQVKTYSSGMMMRLAFSVAISVDPDILVVDEALAVGDEAFQRKCYSRIEDIKRNGTSILFVTQSTQLVLETCDRVIVLNQGALLFDGEPHQGINYYYQLSAAKDFQLKPELSRSLSDLNDSLHSITVASSINSEDSGAAAINLGFDESLLSLTAHEVHNKEYGVVIDNIGLYVDEKIPTNILQHLQRYQIRFEVSFKYPLPNISYQVLFKTVNGVPISGSKFYYDDIFDCSFSKSIQQRVEYDFICNLNPGVYFVSIEVCGGFGDESAVFHKFAEVLAFRVVGEKCRSIGYMSVQPRYKVELV
jgi:lipopolysaccharide transport system ATP-binding protein